MAEDNELDIMDEMDGDTPEEEVHSLDIIMDFLANPDNVANRLEDGILKTIGDKISERIQKDEETMKEWVKYVNWGVEVNKQTLGPMDNEGPFKNSANFKSPLMRKSSLAWSDRASIEILRSPEVVKSDIIVKAPKPAPQPPGPEELQQMPPEQAQQIMQTVQSQQQQVSAHDAIKDKGERLSTHLNYQINFQMDWRQSHDKMLYELPNIGNVFKKTFYDPIEQTNITSLIHFPDFIVNMDATGLDEYAFTEKMEVTKNQVLTNIRSGIWIDADLDMDEENEDFDGTFYEHQGWYDLDDDGYEEPYIITIHKASSEVVRIVPRYDEEDVFIMNEDGSMINLLELIEANAESGSEEDPDFEGIEIVKIVGSNMITKYGFIPADDGSYLDWGYYHLLGHLTALINNLTNLAINAGKLANQPGGFIASSFRKAKNIFKIGPGEWKPVDIPASELMNSFYQIPFKGADPSLMALMTDINQQIAQLSSTIDLSNVLNSNAPASTTLALIQENMVSSSAIISRVYRAMAEEFDKLAELNFKHTDPEEYKLIVGDAEADPKIDYSEENINVMHVANPELASKMERIQLGEVAVAQIPMVQQLGGNPTKIMKDFFKAIGYDGGEEVFQQSEGEANAQQKIEMQQQELTKKSQEQHQEQLDMLAKQQELETRKQDLAEAKFDAENQRDNALTSQKLDLNEEEIALKGEEQDRKNEETRLKAEKLPLEQNKLFEEGHKLHEEALNESGTDDRNS